MDFLYAYSLFSLGNCNSNLLLVATLGALPFQGVGLVSRRRINFEFSLTTALGALDRDLGLLLSTLDKGRACCGEFGRTGLLLFLLLIFTCRAAGLLSGTEQWYRCREGEDFSNE